jgi:hypothetical protein
MIQEGNGWQGEYQIIVTGPSGTETVYIKNAITNAGLNMLRDALKGDITNAKLEYIAVGTSSASINNADTSLTSEFFRTPITSYAIGGTGILNTTGILLDNEAVGQIEELGFFAGSTASSATNSGIMISRILFSRNKTNLESIQINRTDTIGRA